MKASNIIIFVLVIIFVVVIVGYAVWKGDSQDEYNENQTVLNVQSENSETTENEQSGNLIITNPQENKLNTNNTVDSDNANIQLQNYVGDWFISKEANINAKKIDEILEKKEKNLITEDEFTKQMESEINTQIAELDVEYYKNNQIKFDFTLKSPAPNQREGKLDNITVKLDKNIGTFTYTDNWGTSGNGKITLEENKIILKLETTKAAQGALWGVEGIYTFSYKSTE